MHFICNVYSKKLQHYAIAFAQKRDNELCIIGGLHNHDPEHKINHISNKQYQDQNSIPGPCHGYGGPHLVRDCENSVCKRGKLSLDTHVPARFPTRKHPAKQQMLNTLYNDSPHRNWPNSHNDPALQLSISTGKPDHMQNC